MLVFDKIIDIKRYLSDFRADNKLIGFIPTMGALHKGHLSLVENAKLENNIVVCSIFINPTQFNDKQDLEKYPRTLDEDKKMLIDSPCDVLFVPSVDEMYPIEDNKVEAANNINLGTLDKLMEGKHRPGHFEGVIQIVRKLFEIINPNTAYFGQKDFQQLAIIKNMVKQLNLPVKVIGCPIIRESDSLAMSSRNIFLSKEERENAPLIYKTLVKVKQLSGKLSVHEIKDFVKKEIGKNKFMQLEYFEIINSHSLIPIDDISTSEEKTACIAVKIGSVRLIDNIILFP